ncbi:hypothetical protein LW135_06535 [Helicobacter sp. faydin-H20]|nr:hypothetical protein [Helicobacter anatolicus]MCE3037476.1 hypothetical protein [Helicobacter anatolicus]
MKKNKDLIYSEKMLQGYKGSYSPKYYAILSRFIVIKKTLKIVDGVK